MTDRVHPSWDQALIDTYAHRIDDQLMANRSKASALQLKSYAVKIDFINRFE